MDELLTIQADGANLSVVVQGPIFGDLQTAGVLGSIRRFLPRSEIVLSTWQGSDLKGLEYDRVVLSEDPGGIARAVSPACPWKHWRDRANNVTRQIVSSHRGLAVVERPFSLKLRTDFRLTSARLPALWRESLRFFRRSEAWKVFEQRVVTLHYAWPIHHVQLFHPSDFLSLGLTSDVRNLWGVDSLAAFSEGDYFVRNPPPTDCPDPWWLSRYAPEQYVWLGCLRKRFDVPFAHRWDNNDESRIISDLSVVNNFYCVSQTSVGIKWLSSKRRREHTDAGSELTWHRLYRDLLGGRERIPIHAYTSECVRLLGVLGEKARYWKNALRDGSLRNEVR